MKFLAPWSIYLAAVFLTPSAVAQQNFPDFCNVSSFTLNGITGSLTPNADCHLRLTNNLGQSGSAFLTNAISLASDASFSTAFSFQITNPINGGADGIVFVVQTVANNVGGAGGGIGYTGIAKSVGVEFDTWFNGEFSDPDASHIGIDLNGSVTSVATKSISPALDNGSIWYAWVDYNGVTDLLEVRLSQSSVRPANADLAYTVDLVSVLTQTNAFVGFTSGTGSAGNQHDILDWEFVGFFDPIGEDEDPVATFEVTKDFTDGNTAEVKVTLSCFTGLPLIQSQMISANRDVKFIVRSFDEDSLNCNITESDVTGYSASYHNGSVTSAVACAYVGLGFGSENVCSITNTPDLVEVEVFKAWFVEGQGGDMADPTYSLELWCNAVIDDYDFYSSGNYGKTLFNGTSFANTHYDADVTPYWKGGSKCWVSEMVYDSSVESSSNCGSSLATAGLMVTLGQGDSCTVTNSVFYEGIPTLNPYGLAMLALLMLGAGFVGFRRFA